MDGVDPVANAGRPRTYTDRLTGEDAAREPFAQQHASALDVASALGKGEVRRHELAMQHHVAVEHDHVRPARCRHRAVPYLGEAKADVLVPDVMQRNRKGCGVSRDHCRRCVAGSVVSDQHLVGKAALLANTPQHHVQCGLPVVRREDQAGLWEAARHRLENLTAVRVALQSTPPTATHRA
jgi:hypothetical protein